jgi:hypothetical protein
MELLWFRGDADFAWLLLLTMANRLYTAIAHYFENIDVVHEFFFGSRI